MITARILAGLVSYSTEEKFSEYLLDFFREKLKKKEGISSGEVNILCAIFADSPFNTENFLRCSAEIVLLQKILTGKNSAAAKKLLGDISPFGSKTPPLKELLSCSRGCMVNIPLHGATPLSMRIYLLEFQDRKRKGDMKEVFRTKTDRDFEKHSVFVQFSDFHPHEFSGDSWRLGVSLGESFLQESRKEVLYALARDWMITGTVKADHSIGKIHLGKKLQIDPNGQWKWLLPESNLPDVENSFQKNCNGVKNMKEALHLVRGSGFQSGQTLDWSGRTDVFYVLLGESWTPVFYSIFCFRPKYVYLFVTEKTRKTAQWIDTVLRDNPCYVPESIQCKFIESNDLVQLDTFFRKLHEEMLQSGKNKSFLFNITGGNRLMGLAAHMVATDYQIPMVYRDVDSGEGIFEYLEHLSQGQYLHSKQRFIISGPEKATSGNRVLPNWKNLSRPLKKEEAKNLIDAESIKAYIFS